MNSYLYGTEAFEIVEKLPGSTATRKTPLGELNWIFTAITDAIAFDILPTELFLRLFRQDVLVASMFRNFLLANRIMRASKVCDFLVVRSFFYSHTHTHSLSLSLLSLLSSTVYPFVCSGFARLFHSPFMGPLGYGGG